MELIDVINNMADFPYPCVIAGGAMRDSYFGKPVSDIDLFVSVTHRMFEQVRLRGVAQFGKSRKGSWVLEAEPLLWRAKDVPTFIVEGAGDYHSPTFLSLRSKDVPNLNLILVVSTCGTTPEFVYNLFFDFPCSLSRIAYDPVNNVTYVDKSFTYSAVERVVLLDKESSAEEYYTKKIKEKYGEWSVIRHKPTVEVEVVRNEH